MQTCRTELNPADIMHVYKVHLLIYLMKLLYIFKIGLVMIKKILIVNFSKTDH